MDLRKAFATAIISTVTTAGASTGGNTTSGSGGTVITGAHSSSVHVVNTVNAGDEGGVSVTHIEMNDDGVVSSTTERHEIPKGGNLTEDVSTSTAHTAVHVETSALGGAMIPHAMKPFIREKKLQRGVPPIRATSSAATSTHRFIDRVGASSGVSQWNLADFFSFRWLGF